MSKAKGGWFRFYNATLESAKVQLIEPHLFRAWVNLLCLASRLHKSGGVFSEAEVAFRLRIIPEQAAAIVDALLAAKLLERVGENLRPHDWSLHQPPSDDSTPRVKEFRKRKEKRPRRRSTAVSETESHLDSRYLDSVDGRSEQDASRAPNGAPGAQQELGFIDLKRELFTRGVAFFKTYNLPEDRARKVLGKWRRDHGDAAVIFALSSAEGNVASDLIPYVEAVLQGRAKAHDQRPNHAFGIFGEIADRLRAGGEASSLHRR